MPQIVSSEGAYGSATKATVNVATPPALVVAPSDGEGNILGTGATPILARIQDGASANVLTVSAFHSGDNQQPGGLAYGLLTGGVAQLLNTSGNLDRQRATGGDVITNVGVATGTQQLAWPATCGPITSGAITASANTAIAAASNNVSLPQPTINVLSTTGFPASGTAAIATNAGIQLVNYTSTTATTLTGCTGGTGLMSTGSSVSQVQTLTLTNVSGTIRGVAWTVSPGQSLVVDTNLASQDAMVILNVNTGPKTVQVVPVKAHSASASATAFFFDQARSAMIADGATGQGLAAGATYLFNGTLNAGAGGWEGERSALGEGDGCSGAGTAVAAEYEWQSGGPILASGLSSGLGYDRARNLPGKGLATATITSTTAGNTSVTFASAAATNLVLPGAPLVLTGSGTTEVVYPTATWSPGSAAVVPLQSPVVNTGQTTATYDTYAPMGPGLNGFTAFGIGIEEECLYDPVSNRYYVERSATGDNVNAQNVVLEAPGLINGSGNVDRMRANVDTTALITATGATTTQTGTDQLNVNARGLIVVLNMTNAGTGSVTLSIQGKDAASATYYTLLAGVAVTTNSTNVYTVYPGGPATANVAANSPLPRTWRVLVTANNVNATTYTVGASVIV